jgi:hypothetical protein
VWLTRTVASVDGSERLSCLVDECRSLCHLVGKVDGHVPRDLAYGMNRASLHRHGGMLWLRWKTLSGPTRS